MKIRIPYPLSIETDVENHTIESGVRKRLVRKYKLFGVTVFCKSTVLSREDEQAWGRL